MSSKLHKQLGEDVLGTLNLENYFQRFISKPPLLVLSEKSANTLFFNVMPGKSVKEELLVHEYRVWEKTVMVKFSRRYSSEMFKSPSHLIFLSSQIHLQKLLYVYLCHHWGHAYDPCKKETIKVWPTRVDTRIPKLIRNEDNLFHIVHIHSLKPRNGSPGTYFLKCVSSINDSMAIYGEALILNLKEKNNV